MTVNRQHCYFSFTHPSPQLPHSPLLTMVLASVLVQMSGQSILLSCPCGSSADCAEHFTTHNALLPTPEKLR